MKALAVGLTLLCAALAQVTVAPLFPVRAAIPDLGLVVLAALMVFAGPRTIMYGLTFFAIWLGFAADRSPSLLLLGYLPLLPAAFCLESAHVPLNRYVQILIAGAGTGAWARAVLAIGAMAHGADFQAVVLVRDVLVPGAILDWALLTVAYVPLRFVGWEPSAMSLQRGSL